MNNTTYFPRFIALISNPYFFVAWLILIICSYCFIDKPLAYFFYQFHHTEFFRITDAISNLGLSSIYFILFLCLYLLCRFVIKNEKYTGMMLFIFLSVLISGIICEIIKILLGRSRPGLLFNQGIYGFHPLLHLSSNMWSFPSGHATAITSVMIALSFIFSRAWWLFTIFLVLISLTRIIVTAHFLSDVLTGMYIGAITAIWVNEILKNRERVNTSRFVWHNKELQ